MIQLNRICYYVCMVSVVVFLVLSLIVIWERHHVEYVWRTFGTACAFLVASAVTLGANCAFMKCTEKR